MHVLRDCWHDSIFQTLHRYTCPLTGVRYPLVRSKCFRRRSRRLTASTHTHLEQNLMIYIFDSIRCNPVDARRECFKGTIGVCTHRGSPWEATGPAIANQICIRKRLSAFALLQCHHRIRKCRRKDRNVQKWDSRNAQNATATMKISVVFTSWMMWCCAYFLLFKTYRLWV